MPACSFPARRPLPSTVRRWPGFLSRASPQTIRSLRRGHSGLHPYTPPRRPTLAGSSAAYRSCVAPLTCRSHQPLTGTVRAFIVFTTNTPSADFCRPIRTDPSALSPDSRTNGRSPAVSSTAFRTPPPNLQPVLLMDTDFVVHCQLVPHRMPHIRCLYFGSCLCSTLLSDPASRPRPCASL